MKKAKQHFGEYLPPVRLYLEDVQETCSMLAETCARVSIETPGFELDSAQELTDLKTPSLSQLTVRGSEPCISLDLRPNHVYLSIDDNTPAQRGTFEKVKALLRSKSSLALRLAKHQALFGLIGGIAVGMLTIGYEKSGVLMLLGGFGFLSLGLVFAYLSFQICTRRWAIINTCSRRDRNGFWRRNADQIALATISAVLGAVITFVITSLLD